MWRKLWRSTDTPRKEYIDKLEKMAKASLATLGVIILILLYSVSPSDQVFYATKTISIALAMAAVALWALWALGKEEEL